MKTFVRSSILATMAALMLGGSAWADAPAKKRKPTFLEQLFGNPGSTELPMLKGMPFPYVMGLNEAVVMGMADGYARSTGRPALVNLHSSAGTGHSLGNLFTAFKNNSPIVVTAGQQARSILPYDPFLGAERPSEFPRPFVKYSIEPARAEDVPLALARAFAVATTAPMGPVSVEVPIDIQRTQIPRPAALDTLMVASLARPTLVKVRVPFKVSVLALECSSAALAPPLLTMKLECFAEIDAPPMRRPFRPQASISRAAWSPGGLRNTDPALGIPSGCAAMRCASSFLMVARDSSPSPWSILKVAATNHS